MTRDEIEEIMAGIAPVLKEFVSSELAPLRARLDKIAIDPAAPVGAIARGVTAEQVEEALNAVAQAAKTFVDAEILKLKKRIDELETRAPFKFYGPWTERVYPQNACVSFGGSMFIARRATTAKPDVNNEGDWEIAVRPGRDGKDSKR